MRDKNLNTHPRVNDVVGYYMASIVSILVYISIIIYSIRQISYDFGYMGINFFIPSEPLWFIIPVLCVLPIFKINKIATYPSDYINLFLYLFLYIPAVVVPPFISNPKLFNYDYIIFLIALLFVFLFIQRNGKKSVKNILLDQISPVSKERIGVVFLCIYIVFLLILISSFGFSLTLPSFEDIYDVRLEFREIVKGTTFTQYIIGWLGYIANPFILLIGLSKKKKDLIILSVVLQLYIFSIMALKSHIGVLFLTVILFFVMKKVKNIFSVKKFIFFIILTLSLIIAIDLLSNNAALITLLVRRVIIVPAQLTYYHFDFFSMHSFTYWGHSILKPLDLYSYAVSPPKVIGDVYFGMPEMTAVVNVFMEGYTAFGYIGLVIVMFIMKYILQIFDYLYERSFYNPLIIIMALIMSMSFNSSGVTTVLLTHGVLLFFITCIIYPWIDESEN